MQIKAPAGFQPQDVRQRQNPPVPCRSRYRKFDIYRDVQQFNYIDTHAIQVAQQDHDNFSDLIWHLVYSQKNIQSELDKARVIFRWMTSKNMYTIQFRDGAQAGSPEEVLLSFKNKQGTYARIFETLCRFSDLHCAVLTGYAKGLDYRPGDQFKTNDYNHSWNGVLIDGNWYLVDSHWATRYLTSEKNKPENLVYEYDDFYFLTDPEQLIYSHWAHKKEWQLLSRNISLQDFENLPLVKSYFFKCSMFFISHHVGVVNTDKGCIAITLGHGKPTNFTYKITFADTNDEIFQGQKLKNYALQEHGRNQTSTFIFRAPRPGQYYFTIFAQLLTGELGVKNVFTASAEFKVIADQPAMDAVPLPNCSDSSWGPGVAVDQMGLVASPPQGVIACPDGKVKLEFKKTRPAFILAKLRKNGMRDEDLEHCIQDDDQNDKVVVTADLPQKGEYGIEIYGNDPSRDGDTYTHICQYYVHYADPSDQDKAFYQASPESRVYMGGPNDMMNSQGGYSPDSRGTVSDRITMADKPTLPHGYLGPQPKFAQLGLSTMSHNNPEINVNDNELEIKLQTTQPLKVTSNLINVKRDQTSKEHAFQQTDSNLVSFHIILPETGYFKFQIFALPASDESRQLPGVFNYLINCTQATKPCHPFPKQYAPWLEGGFLYEPLYLSRDNQLNNVHFKLKIPKAESVAVTVDGDWQHLQKTGEADVWEGNVSLEKIREKTDPKVSLNANYGGDQSKYAVLLDYKL
ncbi:hillarin-like [Gigantopelta aegis]|uniref:hillarin-like n=1 Tax=Gigantopelta aegis TaxID=1735272 RepID=UPI001B88DD3B|nr:hillarin-like [Gigantopelta aegis]